jgi:two-component system KDP operon response regulator KdpE
VTFVLVVDDDPAMRRTLSINLRARDYEVETAGDGRSALQVVEERMPDVVLLDLGLPDLDGIAVLRQLRSFTQVPVIVVSARSESDDKVEALDLGADDFITKPFSIEELLARVRATSRRVGREEPDLVVEVDGLRLDVTDSRATRDGEEIHLTPIEWKLVEVLVRRRGRLVRQAELLTAVWGPAYDTQTNYLRVHLASIRRKLEADPSHPVLFVTEPGMGYRFAPLGS